MTETMTPRVTDTMIPRALAALLCYPTEDLVDALPDLAPILPPTVAPLIAYLGGTDLLDAQERYVGLFDRTRSVSLHLFEHVHGDGRERGPAMVELNGLYADAGLFPDTHELPDFLPMLLEFASVSPEQGQALLTNAAPVIDLLHQRLDDRESPYATAIAAVLHWIGRQPTRQDVPEDAPEDLDKTWEEAEVLFGPGSDPTSECATTPNLAARLRAARRSPNPTPRRPVLRHVAAASQG